MAFDLETIIDNAAKAAAKELDEKLPDGFIQSGGAQALQLIGRLITKVGDELAGTENNDGDA